MNFIIPQNYKFNSKFLGIIDYQTAILNLLWAGVVFLLINVVFQNLNIKIFLFIIFTFPVFIFSIVGVNGESLINVIIYMSKFILKPNLLFYSK